jgi:hypothetical protein
MGAGRRGELPISIVAKILCVTRDTVPVLKSLGNLIDYAPENVRAYLRRCLSRTAAEELKRRARSKESNLRWEIRRLRDRLRANAIGNLAQN